MMNFDGKTVLITGASRGIGAATAKLFARYGARVAINYWSRADKPYAGSVEQVLEAIEADGGTARPYNADIRNSAHIEKMVSSIKRELGPVTHAVFNAFIPFQPKRLSDYDLDEFEKKVNSDIRSYFLLSSAVLPDMIENREGVFVGVSSGQSKVPNERFSAYSMAKAALNSLMRSIAVEYGGYGIRANTVAPGFTDTDPNKTVSEADRRAIAAITPLGRIGEPDDVARAIVLMASEYARFITGGYLPVDGGVTML